MKAKPRLKKVTIFLFFMCTGRLNLHRDIQADRVKHAMFARDSAWIFPLEVCSPVAGYKAAVAAGAAQEGGVVCALASTKATALPCVTVAAGACVKRNRDALLHSKRSQ